VLTRCAALRHSFREDLGILESRCGVKVDICEDPDGLCVKGPPPAQRSAIEELQSLIRFYFPEYAGATLPIEWWKDADPLCEMVEEGMESACVPEETMPDGHICLWASALRREWSEDDDIHDEDLPCEPLEAPDDGPEVFEGDMQVPKHHLERELRIVMLVGCPGSGKSTFARRFDDASWKTINQDTLGDRRACVAVARQALAAGNGIVIDRCNISFLQRSVWLNLADEYDVSVGCIWLDVDAAESGARVLLRFGHPTLPAELSSLKVIDDFKSRMEPPMEAEGFVLWHVGGCDDELDDVLAEVSELRSRSREEAARSYEEAKRNHKGAKAKPWWMGDGQGQPVQQEVNPGFRYVERRGRAARGQYLRAVRRQVEYYFSDANLRKDWFFQEKISTEPEKGWLEIRWILSCPRIRDVLQACTADVLDALKPSTLMVKQAAGAHWLGRGRPLPPLLEERPEEGAEPDWYLALHAGIPAADADVDATTAPSPVAAVAVASAPAAVAASAQADAASKSEQKDADPRCKVCGAVKPRDCFTKAQLTKNRRSPTCKDCIAAVG